MMMGYILPRRYKAVYTMAISIDKVPCFASNLDAVIYKLSPDKEIDADTMKILDYWHYVLSTK
jgi:hypothetical protein